MSRIVLLGGHGKVALHLSRLLVERGDAVEAVIRNPEHTAEVEATGARAVVGDLESLDRPQLGALLLGADAVVWSAGAGGGSASRTDAVDREAAILSMTAAADAGVDRYVMVSYFGARIDHGVPPTDSFFAYAEAKAAADDALRASDLAWTILAPSRLTDEPGTGRIAVDGDGSAPVPRADVAAVAAAVLADPGTRGRTISFTGGDVAIADAL